LRAWAGSTWLVTVCSVRRLCAVLRPFRQSALTLL